MHLPPLRIIATSAPDWLETARQTLASGTNFFLLADDAVDVAQHLPAFRDHSFAPLEKWAIYGFKSDLSDQDTSRLLEACRQDKRVFFVEQKELQPSVPARYIVYCEVRGIISRHDSLDTAQDACQRYVERFPRARLFPDVGIYEVRQDGWRQVRSFC